MIKNILFDFGNVLVEFNEEKMVRNFSQDEEDQKLLKQVIWSSEEYYQTDAGQMTYEELTKRCLSKVPDRLKPTVEQIMSTWYTYMEVDQNTVELIKALKQKGYNVFALSNVSEVVYEYIKSLEVGEYFDGFSISAIEKLMKPDRRIYERTLEKFGLNPEECFFIDDKSENIAAGQECGIIGHVFNKDEFEKLLYQLKEHGVDVETVLKDVKGQTRIKGVEKVNIGPVCTKSLENKTIDKEEQDEER